MSVISVGVASATLFVGLLALGLVAGLLWLVWRILRLVLLLAVRLLGFARREVVDGVQTLGALLTALATVPLTLVNLAIFRLSSAKHYGRAFVDELRGVGRGVWRVALGNPLRFLGLRGLVDGVESRLPDVMERAPRHRARRANFEGYEVFGTLPSGGSGAQLFIARPKSATHQRFLRAGRVLPAEVVIKSFALESGSTLPQIVRESRALEAASRLGLVCEHQLTDDHFYYVMPYVKGEDLERVKSALHARGTAEGLADAELALLLGYSIDLMDSLHRFHMGGLWHKDIKPANIIVAKGRAHLVDFGLVTPLASALTLTTHGTEYYRDPEMVRLAMQGVKVHEVDGARFDVYSAGAVLYSLIENSFPAHGNLSRLSKRCPEALRWIVQRAMAEMSSRYHSAAEMRIDLAALAEAADPFAMRPADLPSFGSSEEPRPAPVANPFLDPRPPLAGAFPESVPLPAAPVLPLRARRRSRHRGLAVAVGLGGAFFFLASAVLFSGRGPGQAHATVHSVGSTRGPGLRLQSSGGSRQVVNLGRGVYAELPRLSSLPAPSGPSGPFRSGQGGAVASAARVPEGAPGGIEARGVAESPQDVPTAAIPPRGRVLVLDDLATGADARVVALLRKRLSERGFRVVGQEQDEAAASVAIEQIASARHAVGIGRAEEPETQANLQGFLDDSPDLDALILVSRSSDEKEHLYRVFLRAGAGVTH